MKKLISDSNNYKCKHCGKVVKRYSYAKWIKSYCEKTGKDVHLMRVKK